MSFTRLVNRLANSKTLPRFQNVIFLLFAGFLCLQIFNTLQWRLEHDVAYLHYTAFLIDRFDMVPYRDFLETTLPGAFAFHFLVGKLFGYGDLAFRIVDLLLLGALLAATYLFMSRFGRWTALWAVVMFGLLYLRRGQTHVLQRDYIGIIPIAFALLTIPPKIDRPPGLWRFALAGLLFGLAVTIKPHLAIGFPVVFVTLLAFRWHNRKKSFLDFLICSAVSAAAILLPSIIAVVWLSANSALEPFLELLLEYFPLYNALTGDLESISQSQRLLYLVSSTFSKNSYWVFIPVALFAYYRASKYAGQDRAIDFSLLCLAFCTATYAVYPTIAAKFWQYHYVPFAYFLTLSVALLLYKWSPHAISNEIKRLQPWMPLAILLIAATIQLKIPFYVLATVEELQLGPEAHAPKGGRVDEMAEWLDSQLLPGDTIQALDFTGGTHQAMLLTQARPATMFLQDYHFFHHTSSPLIKRYRESFISALRGEPPRFMVAVITRKPWVSGIDTTRSFPELRQFLDDEYVLAHEGDGYYIFEHVNVGRESWYNAPRLHP